jgi:hypothetical protein
MIKLDSTNLLVLQSPNKVLRTASQTNNKKGMIRINSPILKPCATYNTITVIYNYNNNGIECILQNGWSVSSFGKIQNMVISITRFRK